MNTKALALIGCLVGLPPCFAQDRLQTAPEQLTLPATRDPASEQCRRVDKVDAADFGSLSLHRTFHDDFDEHPLKHGKWLPHYSGGAAWPEAQYWGGARSQLKRQTKYNGENQTSAH